MLAPLITLVIFQGFQLTTASNILFILTDDLDTALGSSNSLVKTKSWIVHQGITFPNAYATNPICCPSRAGMLTGRYQHNHRVYNVSTSGGCFDTKWMEGLERTSTYAKLIHDTGKYRTFHAGKYLNNYHDVTHIPPGWDEWHTNMDPSQTYLNYNMSVNGVIEEYYDDYEKDYSVDVQANKTKDFIQDWKENHSEKNFLAVLSFGAPNFPYDANPKYETEFLDIKAPRTPAFNNMEADNYMKHWVVSGQVRPLSQSAINAMDEVYRKRLRTLLSVDDAIDGVMRLLDSLNVLEDTFVFFTSDHGRHFGQFGIPEGKNQPYEFDNLVPFWVRGPQIQPYTYSDSTALLIDLAPTFVEIAVGRAPEEMDGKSLLPNLQNRQQEGNKRDSFIISHQGLSREADLGYKSELCYIQKRYPQEMFWCQHQYDCRCQDGRNNTFNCVRTISERQNDIFCQFEDNDAFIEYYDLNSDPFQLYNLAPNMDQSSINEHADKLQELLNCSGMNCQVTSTSASPGNTKNFLFLSVVLGLLIDYLS